MKAKLILAVLATTAAVVTMAGAQAQASPNTAAVPGQPIYLAADLRGSNEVGAPGTVVGDPDGRAVAVLRIQGSQVSYAFAWRNITAPIAGHVHAGVAGVNGPIRIGFFGTALPDTATAVAGSVTVTDQALLDAVIANPASFYANIHTAQFPAGAIRGQLRRLSHPIDPRQILAFASLISIDTGDQEIAGGDPDGFATGFIRASGTRVDYAFTWTGIAPPSAGHIHRGPVGVNGPIVVPLFSAPGGLPASVNGIAGRVTGIDSALTRSINRTPRAFYTNLHNADFPDGAVRGQLFRLGSSSSSADALTQLAG
jgi:hypothetical protein